MFVQIVTGDRFILVHLSIEEACVFVYRKVLKPRSFVIFIV